VLIVEDDFLLASYSAKVLENEGARIVGPAASVEKALALLGSETPDAAILDVNLNGETTLAVADALRVRGVPFIVVTGYGEDDLRSDVLRDAQRLEKPVQAKILLQALAERISKDRSTQQTSPQHPAP
jgi:DNA-binding response OmpR family regulator